MTPAQTPQIDVDVVVVGAGAAGLSAALEVHAAGATVLVAEAEHVIGGASRLSGGVLMAADTAIHRKAGIHDSAHDMIFDYLLANQYQVKLGLVQRLADEGAPMVDWLIGLGLEFYDEPMGGIDERSPRSHSPVGGGEALVDVLSSACRERGIDIALGQRVDRLIVDNGVVRGVAVGDDELRSNAVVITTGGFGNNPELRAKYLPTLAAKGDWVYYIGPDGNLGDALQLGEQVGANMVGFDRCTPLMAPYLGGQRDFDSFIASWFLLLGADGRRMCLETIPYGHLGHLVNANGGRAFGLFDSKTLAENGTPALPTFKVEAGGKAKQARLWNSDGIRRLVQNGAAFEAQTIDELAEKLGLPVDHVRGSVERYNASAHAGHDLDFEKDPRFLRAVEHPPFYGVEVRPAAFGHTLYGLEIDPNAAVIDQSSRAVPGLFAGGECTGGVIGPRYVGSGNNLANAIVFGRQAGRSAAAFALANPTAG